MPQFQLLFFSAALVAVTVVIHAAGLAELLKGFVRPSSPKQLRVWPFTWILIRVAWWLILMHLVEIAVWGLFYLWQGCMPDRNSAFYFAGVTYTTLGYGDLLLPLKWRLFGPIEAMTGILMCGLSTGAFFTITSRLLQGQAQIE